MARVRFELGDGVGEIVVDDPPLTILAIAPNGSTSASINISRQEIGLPAGADSLADVVRKAAGLS